MKCMRCGEAIAPGAVFCEECLAEMKNHPVKPGTPVNLPRREKQQPVKRSRRRFHKPEEQIGVLRRLVLFLLAVILALVIALTGATYHLLQRGDAKLGGFLQDPNCSTSASEG